MPPRINKILMFLAKPVLLFYTLPWLLVILILGTISQRYIGLYEAEKLFFSSYIIWFGPIPLPGMIIVLGILGVSITAKLILKSPWRRQTSGSVVTHMGALLLLLGGLLTAITAQEGSIVLAKGQEVSAVSDYNQRELAVLKNGVLLQSLTYEELKNGVEMNHSQLPFTLQVASVCRHCKVGPVDKANAQYHGIAEKISLATTQLRREDEENRFGVTFSITGVDGKQDGTYIAFEIAPQQPSVTIEGDTYEIIARKAKRSLPFAVRLESFEKYSYPGTDVASEYESIVTIVDNGSEWRSPIRMNEPLRYKGHTLYQSSFLHADGETFSVLSVVKNAGRVFPYIASIMMCVGLLIHLWVRRRKTVA